MRGAHARAHAPARAEVPRRGVRRARPAGSMACGMSKYVVERRIGVGSYGSAYLIRSKADRSRCFVLKKIRLDNVGARERKVRGVRVRAHEVTASRRGR